MQENLRMATDKVVRHAFLLQSKGVRFTNGNVFSPLVEDITFVFAKDAGAHEIKIHGLRSFTNENIANYTDEIIDKITSYVHESTDQSFSSVLKQADNLYLGDFRTNRIKRSDVNLLRTPSARNDTFYMPARSDPVFGMNMRDALLLTRAHTAPADLEAFSQKALDMTKTQLSQRLGDAPRVASSLNSPGEQKEKSL